MGLRSIKKAALCGLDPKRAAKKIQRMTRKHKAEKTKSRKSRRSPKQDARQGDGAVRGVRVHRLPPLGGPRGHPALPPLGRSLSRSRSSSNTRAAKTIQHIWRNREMINRLKVFHHIYNQYTVVFFYQKMRMGQNYSKNVVIG